MCPCCFVILDKGVGHCLRMAPYLDTFGGLCVHQYLFVGVLVELLLLITNPEAGAIASGLAGACQRAGIDWAVFLTNDGVKVLRDDAVAAALQHAGSAIVCQDSWGAHMAGHPCPLELGSQTNNSALVSQAVRVVSL